MNTKEINPVKASDILRNTIIFLTLLIFIGVKVLAQNSSTDLAKYTPTWIKDGFVDAGATHEPWIFQVRR